MNGRSVPWRKKPTQEIQETFEDASQLKLYLLQEIGPTSFVFKDEEENKFKLSIGHEISCSCSPHRKDHCIHTLYVCLKIFKLDKDNPLAWQGSYIDSEIADLIRFRYNPNGAQKPKKIEKFLKKSSNPIVQQANKSTNNRQSLNEDDMCPICHEDLKEEEGSTFCKKECGNNFHLKCSLIWAEHRHKIGDKISCPMCRSDWGPRAYENLVKEFQEFESRLILHKGHKCGGCKGTKPKAIKGKLYRCVYCENFELCEKCFQNFEHSEHHRYIMKENINDQWKPALNRDKSLINSHTKNSLDVFNEIMGHGGLSSNNPISLFRGFHRLGGNNYEGEMSLEDFLLCCFPDLNADLDIVHGKPNSLTIVGHDVKKNCSSCHTDKTDVSRIKRLNCGHVMHAHCILEAIKNRNFKCPDDGIEFLKGYRNTVVQRENPIINKTSDKLEPKVQNQNKLLKKPFEEEKSNRNNTRLGPLSLDIKGKGVSASETNIESATIFNAIDPFLRQKPQAILSKNIFKKPPPHSKTSIKNNSKDISLPPLFEIQGTNINNNDQQAPQAVNNLIKKPLMPIHQNTSNNNERVSPLGMQSFKISSTSVRVQPRKTKKVVSQAGVKTMPRNSGLIGQARSAHSERNQETISQNIEDREGNTTDYEDLSNENF